MVRFRAFVKAKRVANGSTTVLAHTTNPNGKKKLALNSNATGLSTPDAESTANRQVATPMYVWLSVCKKKGTRAILRKLDCTCARHDVLTHIGGN